MIQIIAGILAAAVIGTETPDEWAKDKAWLNMTDSQRIEACTDIKARAAGMTEDEFILLSSVIEAESDRRSQDGRVLIALTIINRKESASFPNSISGVINQSGQFSVIANGRARAIGPTPEADAAIFEALRWQASGEAPNVIYFNCVGYNHLGNPYCKAGDNYFETV